MTAYKFARLETEDFVITVTKSAAAVAYELSSAMEVFVLWLHTGKTRKRIVQIRGSCPEISLRT